MEKERSMRLEEKLRESIQEHEEYLKTLQRINRENFELNSMLKELKITNKQYVK